jgi:hypothetical protein
MTQHGHVFQVLRFSPPYDEMVHGDNDTVCGLSDIPVPIGSPQPGLALMVLEEGVEPSCSVKSAGF